MISGTPEEEGIKAIIFLQKHAGITVGPEKAKEMWLNLNTKEQQVTLDTWEALSMNLDKTQNSEGIVTMTLPEGAAKQAAEDPDNFKQFMMQRGVRVFDMRLPEVDFVPFCPYCYEPIIQGEPVSKMKLNGGMVHIECAVRLSTGSEDHNRRIGAHETGTCKPDDPSLTKREAAKLSYAAWLETPLGKEATKRNEAANN